MDLLLEKWKEILLGIKQEHMVSDVSFDTWLKDLIPYNVEENKLYILVPPKHDQQMTIDYITRKYKKPFLVAIEEITGEHYDELVFILKEQAQEKFIASFPNKYNEENQSNLNPNYTFDNFVVGKNNSFAHAAALAVAESPGEVYNPLYIHGGPGLGKTHLLQSIGHFILSQKPNKKILYTTSEEFTNEVIDSIRNGNSSSMAKLRNKYRTVDVLMVDDIQFIIGKESTQEEFFHTFNVLHSSGKQIILSSDKPPKDIETLEERIRSRFEWGLLADIGYPDYETRMAILRNKEESNEFHLNDEILDYIASNIKSNVRELEGALNKLLAYSKLQKTEITMDIAVHELQNIISPNKEMEITPQLIIEVVCEHFKLSEVQMLSKKRSSDISKPRQIAMYLIRNLTDTSLKTIGTLLGGRDHTTIIHGIEQIDHEYQTSEIMQNTIETVKKKINPN
ncbi:chromosomal replication initiator protein DnaA [Clostridia bacterium]|nr:chromosomal replication initiator protein DnaA [Clostridia bacterium]